MGGGPWMEMLPFTRRCAAFPGIAMRTQRTFRLGPSRPVPRPVNWHSTGTRRGPKANARQHRLTERLNSQISPSTAVHPVWERRSPCPLLDRTNPPTPYAT